MSETSERRAVTGLTPVSEVLGHEERIAALEAQLAKQQRDTQELWIQALRLSQMIGSAWDALNALADQASKGVALHQQAATRLAAMEHTRGNDARLSDVLAGIEERLGRIELGDERLLP